MKPFRDQPRERQTLKKRPTSTGHRASVYTEVFEHILAFAVTEGSAAAKASERMLVRAQGGFDAHHFVFRLTCRTSKLGRVLHAALLPAEIELRYNGIQHGRLSPIQGGQHAGVSQSIRDATP